MTPEPARACPLCTRLVDYRADAARRHPDWFNGAVPSFGDPGARLLVLGLAPGLAGANRTGRPFTGDSSGAFLYTTLARFGFAGSTAADGPEDGLRLTGCMVTNAVRCVPPANRPTAAEVAACRPFLAARVAALPGLAAVVCLGRIAHEALVRALGARLADHRFAHGSRHDLARGGRSLAVFDSYHCSRYNVNTGRLTAPMFEAVFSAVRAHLGAAAA
jgi:uracil-DNA glycosylase family 4